MEYKARNSILIAVNFSPGYVCLDRRPTINKNARGLMLYCRDKYIVEADVVSSCINKEYEFLCVNIQIHRKKK